MKPSDSAAVPASRTRPVRFAVVGCGMLARMQHIPNLAKSDKTELALCCDLDEAVLQQLASQYPGLRTANDFHAAVNDPDIDAICLATTEKLRFPVIEAAAKAGKPIYVEKPLATSMDEINRIHQVVRAADIPFCVGHNRRASPAMREAHTIFRAHMDNPAPCPWRFDREGDARPHLDDDGTPGMSVRVNDDWYSWKKWVFDKEQAPHGPMLFEMTHFTDMCNWFMAANPVEVMAMEQGMFNHATTIRYDNGAMATIVMCANGTFGYGKELYELMGNGGFLRIDHMLEIHTAGIANAPAKQTFPITNDQYPDVGQEGGMSGWLAKKRAGCDDAVKSGDPMKQFVGEPDKGHAHALNRFVDEIQGQGPRVCGIDDAVQATRVAFAAIRSAHEGRTIRIDDV